MDTLSIKGSVMTKFIEMEEPPIVGGTTPWAAALDCMERRKGAEHQSLLLCSLTAAAV